MNHFTKTGAAALLAMSWAYPLTARPIVFAHSTTVMAEYTEDAMWEAQLFYAPRYNLSYGLGHLEIGHDPNNEQRITYARLNFLAKRWNLEAAQANVFVWGGGGTVHVTDWVPEVPGAPGGGHDHGDGEPTVPGYQRTRADYVWNAGAQVDYETRRIYTSLKTDAYHSPIFDHRSDTLQFGIAPYKHDTNTLATWLVVSATRHSGDSHEGDELAFLLRFFKKRTWIEAGATTDGQFRARAMFSL